MSEGEEQKKIAEERTDRRGKRGKKMRRKRRNNEMEA